MEPGRIKLYGLFPMTRRRYVAQLVASALLVVVVLVIWVVHRTTTHPEVALAASPSLRLVIVLLDLLPWIALGLGVLQGVEAYFVLRAFARKQAEQPPS